MKNKNQNFYLLSTLILCGITTQGCSRSGGYNYEVQKVFQMTGSPAAFDSSTSVSISLTSTLMEKYKFKVGEKSSTDCSEASGYSSENLVTDPLIVDVSSYNDNEIRLCIIGGAGTTWQDEKDATVINWVKDTVPPTNPSSLSVGTVPSGVTTTPPLSWTSGSDSGTGVNFDQVGIFKSSDNSQLGSWQTLASGASISGLALTDATAYYFKVRSVDKAGNKSAEVQSGTWTAVAGGGGGGGAPLISPPAGLSDCATANPGGLCSSGIIFINVADAGYGKKIFMTTPGNCTGATLNPVCDNTTDTLQKTIISSGTAQGSGGSCVFASGYTSDGMANTTASLSIADIDAPKYCDDLVFGGYSDWYLPSVQELDVISSNRATLTTLANARYWTSSLGTLIPDGTGCAGNPTTGLVNGIPFLSYNKNYNKNSLNIRCIRRSEVGTITISSTTEFTQNLPANSAYQTVTVTNPYNQPTEVLSLSISSNDFQINASNDHCSGVALPAGGTCTFEVRASATVSKYFSATLKAGTSVAFNTITLKGVAIRDPAGALTEGDVYPGRMIYIGTKTLKYAGDASPVLRYYMSTPSGCTDTVNNPVCDNSADTVKRVFGTANANYGTLSQMDGPTATSDLMAFSDTAAAKYCNDLVYAGHSDWFLPTSNEAQKIFNVNLLSTGARYWLSYGGSVGYNGPTSTSGSYSSSAFGDLNFVRCIRTFTP